MRIDRWDDSVNLPPVCCMDFSQQIKRTYNGRINPEQVGTEITVNSGPSIADYSRRFFFTFYVYCMGHKEFEGEENQEGNKPELVSESDMDSKLWAKLPDELLTVVLAHLPRSCNLRLREVSKSWNSVLRDFELLRRYNSPARNPYNLEYNVSPRLTCLVVGNATHCSIFNLSVQKWFSISHSSLLPGLPYADEYQVVAACGGAFLMESRVEELGRFLVNPLNKTHRELPPLPPPDLGFRSTCTVLGMSVDHKTSRVQKIIAEQTEYEEPESPTPDGDPLGTTKFSEIYIYDFDRIPCKWELVTSLQSEIDLGLEVESAVFVGGALYVLFVQPFGWCWMYRVFRAQESSWMELQADMVHDLGHVHLFEHRGNLMLVGGMDVFKSDEPLCIGVWRFCRDEETWDLILSMPDELVTKLCVVPKNGMFYHFDVEEDHACFINPFTEVTVTCDLVRNVWNCLDRLNHGTNFQDVDDLVFMFHPRLDVVF
ncbi:hypothetical protein R1sor_001821 [Riccia sorocarpa]|uniref:F-box domain-containing protein n=1 Tax=Riccia sorocarpa TaxID=122646 RepID=A0ABD3H114_9MARC